MVYVDLDREHSRYRSCFITSKSIDPSHRFVPIQQHSMRTRNNKRGILHMLRSKHRIKLCLFSLVVLALVVIL